MVVDLPRLVRRLTLTANSETLVFQPLFTDPDKSLKRSFTLIIDLFVSLYRLFGSNAEELEQSLFACVFKDEKAIEAESMCLEMLDILQQHSPQSYGALRMINQSVILICFFELKSTLLKNYATRDVRTEDGWRVNLDVSPAKGFTITHVRKELCGGGEQQQEFKLEWSISMEFDATVTCLRKTRLVMRSIQFTDETTSDKDLQQLKRELCIGQSFEDEGEATVEQI